MNIRHTVLAVVSIFATALLQTSAQFGAFRVGDVSPDIVLMVLTFHGLLWGSFSNQFLGFGAGLLMDILSGALLGVHSFAMTVCGYAAGLASRTIHPDNVVSFMALVGGLTILKGFTQSLLVAGFLDVGQGAGIATTILPEAFYNILVSFFVLSAMNRIPWRGGGIRA